MPLNLRGETQLNAEFSGQDLAVADLSNAMLSGSNFSEADLEGADFSEATVNDADFSGAILADCYFTCASAVGANFSGANLTDADFSEAELSGADFTGANLSGVDFSGADLTGAKGLPAAPVVPDIDAQILAKVAGADAVGSLEMGWWHVCKTTHCRAGWAITLAGAEGAALEAEHGPSVAGALIYAASRPGLRVPHWNTDEEDALADMRAAAGVPGPDTETD